MASHFAADAPHLASCRPSAPEDRRSHPSGEALPTAPLAASAAPDFRPKAKGDPFDVRTEPTVPKPRCVIEAIEPMKGLRLEDRKLYNVILALSWDRLQDPAASGGFSAPAIALRRAIDRKTAVDNQRLRDSLCRLERTKLSFPRLRLEGAPCEETMPLVSWAFLPKGGRMAEWDFPPAIRRDLAAPPVWTQLHLAACARFKSKYALLLYERLSLRRNLRHPVWRVSVDELRAQLGASQRLAGWDPLRRRVIEPALVQIATYTPLEVSMEPRSAPGSRLVTEIVFTVGVRSEPGTRFWLPRRS